MRSLRAEERRSATAERITSGRLPFPRWVSVEPGASVTGRCNGCGDIVVLEGEVTFQFHDECFEVYNRTSAGRA